jgi:rod shape-determining protein MreC
MDSFLIRFKNPLVLIAIVLAQVIALAMQVQRPVRGSVPVPGAGGAPDNGHVALLRRWTVAVVTPLERAVQGTTEHVKSAWFDYVDLRDTRLQDKELQTTVARLREEQAADAEDAAQGRRLQKLLAFKEQYISSTVAAQVIGTSGSERSRVVYLDKGWADGLRPEQAVMTPEGVVGKLRDVFPHTAQVLLIDDASSGAGVVLVGSRIRGILRGTASGQVEIDNLTADSRIKPGEQVVTSGGDMV